MNLDKNAVVAELTCLPMFHAMDAELIDHLATSVREKYLQKGEILFHRGDKPKGFYLVVKGQLKLAIASPHGQEKIVDVLGAKQCFGEAVMFMDRPYPVLAQALMDTYLLLIPQSEVFDLLQKDMRFARSMLAGLSMRLHALIQDVESYSLRSSAERVIGYLLRNSEPGASGPQNVALATSKNVIASLLNLTPETLSRIFHELTEAGLIKVDGKCIELLDPKKLAYYEK